MSLPHPFSQRLRTQQTPAVWLPQDSQTSCSDLRHLSERSALARSELCRTPAFAVAAGCPDYPATRGSRGRWMQARFFADFLLGRHTGRAARKSVARRGETRPAAASNAEQGPLEKQPERNSKPQEGHFCKSVKRPSKLVTNRLCAATAAICRKAKQLWQHGCMMLSI